MAELWTSFHFLRPLWLLLPVPSLVLAVLALRPRKRSEAWTAALAPHLLTHLVEGEQKQLLRSPAAALAGLSLILALALAGPAWRPAPQPEGPDDTTLILVVDLSASMNGRDVGPSRIARMRLELRDLLELRRGSHVGLVAVAGSAHLVMPPTEDLDVLIPYLDVLEPALMPSEGEAFDDAARLVAGLLDAREGDAAVLVIADAIPPAGAAALAELGQRSGVSLLAWAVGTADGLPDEGIPGLERSGFEALEQAGAELIDHSLGSGDLRRIDARLEQARSAGLDRSDASAWRDEGYWLVWPLALACLLWFRRGWVVSLGRAALVVPLCLLLGGCGADLWLTPDQQGRRLFEAGDYAGAAVRFEDPMWKGVAAYAAGDFDQAKQAFARVDSLEGRYNLANAHAQAREIGSAIALYDQVLAEQPRHLAARQNRDLFLDTLAGLQATADGEELAKLPTRPPDESAASLRPDQREGPEDRAAQLLEREAPTEPILDAAQSERWMERVSTSPADFLRAKFMIQASRGPP